VSAVGGAAPGRARRVHGVRRASRLALAAALALALAAQAVAAAPARAERDRGFAGRWLPNVGLVVSRETGRAADGPRGTGVGLSLSLTYFLGSLVPGADDRARTLLGSSLQDAAVRALMFGVGAFAEADLAEAAGTPPGVSAMPRLTLGAHFGGVLGVEAGASLRAAGNGFSTTLNAFVGAYLHTGVFSFGVRIPVGVLGLGAGAAFPEPVTLVAGVVPLPAVSVVADWRGPFHPEPEGRRPPARVAADAPGVAPATVAWFGSPKHQ
jgi:hypothetical protein